MGSEQGPRTAVVTFVGACQAERRVAGVAACARIVREAAQAGFAETWLVVPDGDSLNDAAMEDVRRLAAPMTVEIVDGERAMALEDRNDGGLVSLPGDRLIPAERLAAALARDGDWGGPGSIRLDDPGASAEILRRTAKASDGPVSRRLNRPVSQRISALLVRVPGIRPGHATAGTAFLAVAMFAALVGGGAGGLVAGALLFQAASVFDGVDGEIARATFRSSRRGAVLDSAVDVATNLLLILGLAVNLGSAGNPLSVALAAWGFALFVLGLTTIAWRAARSDGSFSLDLVKHHYRSRFSGRLVPWLIGMATIVSSRDFFALLFASLILLGQPMAVLYIFAAAATVWIMFVIGSVRIAANSILSSSPPAPAMASAAGSDFLKKA